MKQKISMIVAVLTVTVVMVSCGGGKKQTILEGTWINDSQPEWNEVSSSFSEGIGGIIFGGNKMTVFYPHLVKGLNELESLELMRLEFSLNGTSVKLWLKEVRLSRDAVYMVSMSDIIAEAKANGGNVRKLREFRSGEFTFGVNGDKLTIIDTSGCGEGLAGMYTKLK
ncbi:MAG: hypothetical protein LBC31_00390 [Treponema sp.]|jgi:hypothetical protein|nr:hypothetical protein [Treponema sp.]